MGRGRRCHDESTSSEKSVGDRSMQVLDKEIIPLMFPRLEDILSRFAALSVKPVKIKRTRADSLSPVSHLSGSKSESLCADPSQVEARKRRASASPKEPSEIFPASKHRRVGHANLENIPPNAGKNINEQIANAKSNHETKSKNHSHIVAPKKLKISHQ